LKLISTEIIIILLHKTSLEKGRDILLANKFNEMYYFHVDSNQQQSIVTVAYNLGLDLMKKEKKIN